MASSHIPTQLAVDTSDNDHQSTPRRKATSGSLTPPETPVKDTDNNKDSRLYAGISSSTYDQQQQSIVEFQYDLEIERESDSRGNDHYVEFGRGVWSAVYQATSTWSPLPSSLLSSTLTPPSSPITTGSRVLAVKTPLRRDAHAVLKAEARVLSRVVRTQARALDEDEEQYVVPFYGFVPSSNSLVMQAVPLSLSTHIEECAELARQQFSTKTMFEPVLSSAHWQNLATQLIKGLDWLHSEAGVVHGDIKPHNILLRPRPGRQQQRDPMNGNNSSDGPPNFQYDALYADFSSAHCLPLDETSSTSTEALSAVTPPFAAPELMTIAAMRSTEIISTPASDIFALALTLLAAATGDTLVYSGTSSMQRLAMSREGHRALDYVRSGPHASRIAKGRLVDKVVSRGIVKDPSQRPSAREWLDTLNA